MTTGLTWLDYEQRYDYLSAEESKLYDTVKDSSESGDLLLKSLLEKIARLQRAAHCASRY